MPAKSEWNILKFVYYINISN